MLVPLQWLGLSLQAKWEPIDIPGHKQTIGRQPADFRIHKQPRLNLYIYPIALLHPFGLTW